MNFRDALQHEITTQGLAINDIAKASGLSKGAIYNILNGKTEEDRIRAATRRAIAGGCNRDLEILPDGGVRFVEPGEMPDGVPDLPSEVELTLVPDRPFLDQGYLQEPLDWLHGLEEKGMLSGIRTVDRVFRNRDEFLSLVARNAGADSVKGLRFDLTVKFDTTGASERFQISRSVSISPGGSAEHTIFPLAGPAYRLRLTNPVYLDFGGEARGAGDELNYRYEG